MAKERGEENEKKWELGIGGSKYLGEPDAVPAKPKHCGGGRREELGSPPETSGDKTRRAYPVVAWRTCGLSWARLLKQIMPVGVCVGCLF